MDMEQLHTPDTFMLLEAPLEGYEVCMLPKQ